MEHAVFSRLARDLFYEGGSELFYWRDGSHREADFVVRAKEQVQKLIQVCYLLDGQAVPERELASLVKASNELGCKTLLLLTWDLEQKLTANGCEVAAVPLYKWLLQS